MRTYKCVAFTGRGKVLGAMCSSTIKSVDVLLDTLTRYPDVDHISVYRGKTMVKTIYNVGNRWYVNGKCIIDLPCVETVE